MPERWRRELATVDRTSPDFERIRARAQTPSRFPSGPGSRRSRVAAAMTAIVVFALAVSVFVIPTLRDSRGEPTPTAPASPSPSFVPGAPKADALAEAHRLVGLTQVPPGSEALSQSPVEALREAPGGYIACATEPCDTAFDVPAWWSIPLPMDAAISWLQTHPPAGLFLNGDHGSGGSVIVVDWTYQDGPAPAYTRAELTLAVAEDGADRSVLRADGQVLWVPLRTDAEHVPADIGQVRLQEYRGNQLIAHEVLTGTLAAELAGFLNHLGRINMGPPRCPFDSEKADHYTMSFDVPQGSLVFTEWPECQSGPVVFVEADGHAQPALSDSGSPGLYDFLGCQLGTGSPSMCSYLESNSPSASPTADPMAFFCANLHQLSGWFSADIADSHGDDMKLAQKVQGQLSGVMMWFNPNEQAITDHEARAAADGIIIDALALQNWTSVAGTPFTKQLSTFTTDSASFASRYCA